MIRRSVVLLAVAGGAIAGCGGNPDLILVGSKNFTESIILGEIVAQHLESRGFDVQHKQNLGGTFVCHQAIIAGELDIYVEYTGTSYSAILELPSERSAAVVRTTVDSAYAAQWDLVWTEPLGFENTFAMLVRGETARRLNLRTLSDAVPHASAWRPGFGYEFAERADGYDGLRGWYDLNIERRPAIMDLGLTYRALADSSVDLIAGNSTDGLIEALDLIHLEDDRNYFPPYEAAPVVRSETLERHPTIRDALRGLRNTITDADMRRMNYLVDVEQQRIADVAREFLETLPDR
jgi:glycine betaine/choline ABC-type transport system substrate-binding protein